MASQSACPVCGHENIAAEADNCPQCDADLTCFRALAALPEPTADAYSGFRTAAAEPPKNRLMGMAVAVCAFSAVAAALVTIQFFSLLGIESRLEEHASTLTAVLGEIDSRLNRLALNREKMPALESSRDRQTAADLAPGTAATAPAIASEAAAASGGQTPAAGSGILETPAVGPAKAEAATDAAREKARQPMSSRPPRAPSIRLNGDLFEFYQAEDDDVLWEIAKRFYGAGFYYPVILAHNPHLGIYRISQKDRIALLKDADQVQAIYRNITRLEGERIVWRYTVRPGDTLSDIQEKYCPASRNCIQTETGFAPQQELRPGEQLSIQLAGLKR